MQISSKQVQSSILTTDGSKAAPSSPYDALGQRIVNVALPTGPDDGATKSYVDRQGILYALPSAGGKPAALAKSPAGQLWMVSFGAGGSPSKAYGIEAYSLANPERPARLSFTGSPTFAWFSVEQIAFFGVTLFAVANGASPRIAAVNTTNPAAPVQYPGTPLVLGAGSIYDLALSQSGAYAAVPQAGGAGLSIVSVANPAAMAVTWSLGAGQYVAVDGSYWTGGAGARLLAANIVAGTLEVWDVASLPAAPTLVASLPLSTNIRRIVVDTTTNTAFIATASEQRIFVVDLTNLAAPVLLGTIPVGVGGDDTPLRIVGHAGRRVLVVPLNANSVNPGRVQTFDVTTPSAPTFLRVLQIGQNVYDCLPDGGVAYVSNRGGAQELLVVDAAVSLF